MRGDPELVRGPCYEILDRVAIRSIRDVDSWLLETAPEATVVLQIVAKHW